MAQAGVKFWDKLPFSLQLMKFISNFNPSGAITYPSSASISDSIT